MLVTCVVVCGVVCVCGYVRPVLDAGNLCDVV